eukprot:gene44-1844_t
MEPTSKKGRCSRRVGIVGFGKVGSFLAKNVVDSGAAKGVELAWVVDLFAPHNVTACEWLTEGMKQDPSSLDACLARKDVDLVVEVAHPDITKDYGVKILQQCDYLLASTTTFADPDTETALLAEAGNPSGHGVYITPGAFFGSLDIQRMSNAGKLSALSVTMKKHPESLFPVKGTTEFDANEAAKKKDGEVVLYEGPVAALAKLFPVNVNTICTAALAASASLGMAGVTAKLVADRGLEEMIIETRARGLPKADGSPGLRITVIRENPSKKGEVTGQATLNSFLSSLLRVATAPARGDGLHLA